MSEGDKNRVMADVKLLLESLRYSDQQDCTEAFSATAALLSQNKVAQDCFHSVGGLELVLSFAKNCDKEDKKKTALFTLALAVENNSKAQMTLADQTFFKFIRASLNSKSIVIQTTTAFLLLNLCSKNADAQKKARDSRCLHKLCELFKECLPCRTTTSHASDQQWFDNIDSKSVELWTTVCSALCSMVVNPQNEENQRLCCTLFPAATRILRSVGNRELIHPAVSLLGACVMSNYDCQTRLRIVGGIRALVELLKGCLSNGSESEYSAKDIYFIAHLVSNLGSTYAEHAINQNEAGDLGLVELLIKCLSMKCHHGNKIERFRMQCVIALSSAVDACEKNQKLFLEHDGTASLVAMLTQSHDQDFTKLATFVLHCCLVEQSGSGDDVGEDDVLMLAAADQVKRMNMMMKGPTGSQNRQQIQDKSSHPTTHEKRMNMMMKGSTGTQNRQQIQDKSSHSSTHENTHKHQEFASGEGEHQLIEVIQRQHELVSRLENKITELELHTQQGCSSTEPTDMAQMPTAGSGTHGRGAEPTEMAQVPADGSNTHGRGAGESARWEIEIPDLHASQEAMVSRAYKQRTTVTDGRLDRGIQPAERQGIQPAESAKSSDQHSRLTQGRQNREISGLTEKRPIEPRANAQQIGRQFKSNPAAEKRGTKDFSANQQSKACQNNEKRLLKDPLQGCTPTRGLPQRPIRCEEGRQIRKSASENRRVVPEITRKPRLLSLPTNRMQPPDYTPSFTRVSTAVRAQNMSRSFVERSGSQQTSSDVGSRGRNSVREQDSGQQIGRSQESVPGTFRFPDDAVYAKERWNAPINTCTGKVPTTQASSSTTSDTATTNPAPSTTTSNTARSSQISHQATVTASSTGINSSCNSPGLKSVSNSSCNSPGLKSVSTQSEFDYDSDDYDDFDGHNSGYDDSTSDDSSDYNDCSCPNEDEVIMITSGTLYKLA